MRKNHLQTLFKLSFQTLCQPSTGVPDWSIPAWRRIAGRRVNTHFSVSRVIKINILYNCTCKSSYQTAGPGVSR